MKTPDEFVKEYNGKAFDFDHAFGIQCVDGFRVFCRWAFGISWSTGNGYADGYWYNRTKYSKYFLPVSVRELKSGDWVIWARGSHSHPSSHVAMYYNGKEFGQNQGGNRSFCLKTTNFSDALGGLRWNAWNKKETVKNSGANNTSLNVAHGFNKSFNKAFKTTANLNMREGHSTKCRIVAVLPKGSVFRCYGYYENDWLYGNAVVGNKNYTGFCNKNYLR